MIFKYKWKNFEKILKILNRLKLGELTHAIQNMGSKEARKKEKDDIRCT